MATRKAPVSTGRARQKPELNTEVANRLADPFEQLYMGVLRTNDPLLLERGQGSIKIYKDLERDGKVFSVMQKRKLALVSFDWSVTPVVSSTQADADARTMGDIVRELGIDQLSSQIMDSLLTGFEVFEIVWTYRDGAVVPARLVQREQRRFVYVQDDADTPPALRMRTREDMVRGVALPERKFLVHRVNPKDDNPYGMGLGLQTYWPVFFKRAGVVAWNKRIARTGSPVPWGRYHRNASPKEQATLFRALRAMSSDGVLMTPQGAEIELLESKIAAAGGMSSERELLQYMDAWIGEVWTGEISAEAGGGGAVGAASKEREQVRLGLTKADSDMLSETLKAQLLDHIAFFNGLAPCTIYRNVRTEEDSKAQSETDMNVHSLGFDPNETYIQERYGNGWRKREAAPAPAAPIAPTTPPLSAAVDAAEFSEGGARSGQAAIDAAINTIDDAELQEAMRGIFEPLLAAVESASDFEDALARAEAVFPQMDNTRLQALLAHMIFGAELYGRATED